MRNKTKNEVIQEIFNHFKYLSEYWINLNDKTIEEKISGLIFSILAMIDGCSSDLPAIDLVLRPHKDDKKYHIEIGENWYENSMAINEDCMLHEIWANIK